MITQSQRDVLLLAARMLLASLFIIMGWEKITGFDMAVGYLKSLQVPMPAVATIVAIIAELGGGLAILFGVFTTPVALLLAIYTIVSGVIGHHYWTMPAGFPEYDAHIHFYKNMSIAGGMVALAVAGAGRYALTGRNNA
ncbi:DoxX family protein [Bombella sp. TMW 2.2543]|uniref:DoxX family protein n=1 Tax=Bombella pluederhausensis TaxID=2967336 RepID=A0ABT3WLI2_9PROT|nr:DoxX family protein [Bombella pluederhausensis]MCX5618632.1 DoxX family protein [Bombella pluederhausensis]